MHLDIWDVICRLHTSPLRHEVAAGTADAAGGAQRVFVIHPYTFVPAM